MSDTPESLIAYCRDNNRVCPLPQRWDALWKLLPNPGGEHGRPLAPLILAAWHDTPAMLKMLRLADHIEWAAKHDALQPVAAFLHGLREDEWFHLGE